MQASGPLARCVRPYMILALSLAVAAAGEDPPDAEPYSEDCPRNISHYVHEIVRTKELLMPGTPLEDWSRKGLWEKHGDDLAAAVGPERGFIERVNASTLSLEEFSERYQFPHRPVILQGLMDEWPGMKGAWDIKTLAKRFPKAFWFVGKKANGKPLRVDMCEYQVYCETQKDDTPYRIFDNAYGDKESTEGILDDYTIPDYFREDFMTALGHDDRPNFRWFLLGPRRSGTQIHIDPVGTAAWNAQISGRKRWVIYPPGITVNDVRGKWGRPETRATEYARSVRNILLYFLEDVPKFRETLPEWAKPVEFNMNPGEMIFLPGLWAHAILNLDDTIAVTQNFANTENFPSVWQEYRRDSPKKAFTWIENLRGVRPELWDIATRLAHPDAKGDLKKDYAIIKRELEEEERKEREEEEKKEREEEEKKKEKERQKKKAEKAAQEKARAEARQQYQGQQKPAPPGQAQARGDRKARKQARLAGAGVEL